MSTSPGCFFFDFDATLIPELFKEWIEVDLTSCWLTQWREDIAEELGYGGDVAKMRLTAQELQSELASGEAMIGAHCFFYQSGESRWVDRFALNLLGPLPHLYLGWIWSRTKNWTAEQREGFHRFLRRVGSRLNSRYILLVNDSISLSGCSIQNRRLELDLAYARRLDPVCGPIDCLWVAERQGALPPSTFPLIPVRDEMNYTKYTLPALRAESYREQGVSQASLSDHPTWRIPYLEQLCIPLSVPRQNIYARRAVAAIETLLMASEPDFSPFWDAIIAAAYDTPDFTMFRPELELVIALMDLFDEAFTNNPDYLDAPSEAKAAEKELTLLARIKDAYSLYRIQQAANADDSSKPRMSQKPE